MKISQISTCELVIELKKRQGVNSISIPPYESVQEYLKELSSETGPVIVLTIID